MFKQKYFIAACVVGLLGVWLWVGLRPGAVQSEALSAAQGVRPQDGVRDARALLPIPDAPPQPAAKVALGQRLFLEPRLSHDNTIACVTCHDLSHGGVDHRVVSVGIGGQTGSVNAPTVFNASLNFVQFWDGRADSLEAQAAGPVHNPIEMASNWPEVITKLGADAGYRAAFGALYPQGITAASVVDALASFERSLLTPDSRFDQFLKGEASALSALEKAGYRRFVDYGCASCHQGAALGGNMFQRFGVMADYFKQRKTSLADLGRFNVTAREEDRNVFKVPSLRNVAVTGPYFHDGSARSMEQAIVVMGRYQLGRELTDTEVKSIAAFLGTLTGKWQGQVLQ